MDPKAMTEKPENPPAFPSTETFLDGTHYTNHPGMTLRDYFAGQALAGICADYGWGDAFGPESAPLTAITVYRLADAMLARREHWKVSP
jgi:hypothetical protein